GLKEMLRTIPKHKGTEHLQADIKSRIKQLTDELAGPKKGATRTAPLHVVRPEGAGQVCLIGPPNAGKSSLHARLTGSHTDIGPYPFTTKLPVPGMLPFEDMHFQLVDLPPISMDFMEPWFVNALQPADAALLVVDLSDPECTEHILTIRERLTRKKITLEERWPGLDTEPDAWGPPPISNRENESAKEFMNPFHIRLPTLLVANKSDLDPDPDEVKILEELLEVRFPALATSAATGQGLEKLGALLFKGLEVVRVYTKAPGRNTDTGKPFTVHRGDTIHDVAMLVHKDLANSLKFARIWGSGQFAGQQVGPDHQVADGDTIELHV
ncbi:MAG: TGS domain-containing protein, partial [Gammaproteobacteria bacterium]|nr:TGS domain-containing protein [Gammaproteobacteria bacterium]